MPCKSSKLGQIQLVYDEGMNENHIRIIPYIITNKAFHRCSHKRLANRHQVKKIRNWIYFWLCYTTLTLFVMNFFTTPQTTMPCPFIFLLIYLSISRVHEILYTFISDVFDRIGQSKQGQTELNLAHRVQSLGLSYAELIGKFAILAYLVQMLRHDTNSEAYNKPLSVWDAVYFSVMTITTTGYGDIVPIYWASKLLSMYEALSGIVLFVFALGVYLGSNPKQ